MKILHIFGAVVAVHLAVFLVIFAVPGCRSTGKTSPTAASGDSQESTAQLGGEPLSAVGSGVPVAVDTGISYAPAANVRFSPTRPSGEINDHAASSGDILNTAAPAKSYVVMKGDSLWTVAKKNGVTVNDLAKANNLKTSTPLQLGQKLSIPSGASQAVPVAVARSGDTNSESTGPTHVVKGGETLGAIARQHGTTVNTLKRMNGLTSDSLRPGRILLLPEGSVSSMEPAPAPKVTAASTASKASSSTKHTVKGGETLGAIARMYGVSAGELSTLNGIADPRKLQPGRELMIPAGGNAKSRALQASSPAQTSVPTPAPTVSAPQVASPLTPVETETSARPNTDVPVIRIEDPSRVPTNPGGEAPRFD